jgi:hypothetical protein
VIVNGSRTEYSLQVHQASGIVATQAACSFDDAIVLTHDRAATEDQTLDQIAHAVLDRSIRFGV